jgi:hypothetical protein
LLDGLNEDRTPETTKEFVRRVVKRNLVVVSSQFDPNWDRSLEVSRIDLKPFGPEQLLKLIPEIWVNRILSAEYLADLAKLPHTAQLLANYIEENHRLPPLRLDIYRNLRKNFEGDTQVMNLEAVAWRLFRENVKVFQDDETVPKSFCDLAVEAGILTRAAVDYQFRHELIHRFFVACYLQRQDREPLETWHKKVHRGLGRAYWFDAAELLGELYAERAPQDPAAKDYYYGFLRETANFSPQIFAERLYPQVIRLYQAGALKKDSQFIEWAANTMAPAAAQFQNER